MLTGGGASCCVCSCFEHSFSLHDVRCHASDWYPADRTHHVLLLFKTSCYCSVWWFLCSCCFPTPRPLFCQSRLCSLGQCCAVDQSCVAGRGCLLTICCASSRQCGVGVAVVCWCDLREDCPVCMSHVLDCGERWLSVTAGDFLSLTDVCLLENVNWWRSFMLRLLLF